MQSFLPFSRPAIGSEEINAVANVLGSGWITTGPQNHQLETDFCQILVANMRSLYVLQQQECTLHCWRWALALVMRLLRHHRRGFLRLT